MMNLRMQDRARKRLGWTARLLALALSGAQICAIASCSARGTALGAYPAYPARMTQSRTLPIQVTRDVTKIRLTNTTAHDFGPSTMWINAWYSRPIEGLEVGQTLTLDLNEFRDTNGDRFRAGGFFATRRPDTVVLAQLQTEEDLLGLIVVGGGEE